MIHSASLLEKIVMNKEAIVHCLEIFKKTELICLNHGCQLTGFDEFKNLRANQGK